MLFPSGSLEIEVKKDHLSDEVVVLDWPAKSLLYRNLRGKFTISERLGGSEIPLRNTAIELRDLYSSRLIESRNTDVNGDYEFATRDPGIYALRLILPKESGAGSSNRDLAVAIDPSAQEFSLPDLTVVQSDCAGIQLFRRSPR